MILDITVRFCLSLKLEERLSNFVIGDTHGSYDKVMRTLELAKFSDSDTLYFTGDLCDRGTQNKEILDFFMSLGDRFKGCFGNHDVWLYTWLKDEIQLYAREVWYANGGNNTIDSLYDAGIKQKEGWSDKEYVDKLIDFVGSLKYIQSPSEGIRVMHTLTTDEVLLKNIVIHDMKDVYNLSLKDAIETGFLLDTVFDEEIFDRSVLYSSKQFHRYSYSRSVYKENTKDAESVIFNQDNPLTIVGHTPLKEVVYCKDLNTLCIDTGGFADIGRISVVKLDDFTCYDSNGNVQDLDMSKEN